MNQMSYITNKGQGFYFRKGADVLLENLVFQKYNSLQLWVYDFQIVQNNSFIKAINILTFKS